MTNISKLSRRDTRSVEIIYHLGKGSLTLAVLRDMLLEDTEQFDPRDPVGNIRAIKNLLISMKEEGEIIVHGNLDSDDAMIELAL